MLVEKSPLPTWEIGANFLIWIGMIFYGTTELYEQCRPFERYVDHYDDFQKGWFFGRRLDVSDVEWNSFFPFVYELVPFLFVHAGVTEILKFTGMNGWIRSAHLAMSVVYVFSTTNFYVVLLFGGQPIFYYVLMQFKSAMLIRFALALFLSLTMGGYFYASLIEYFSLDGHQTQSFYAFFWMSLRCVSYSIDTIESAGDGGLLEMLAYVLYLPVMHLGPVVLYKNYTGVLAERRIDLARRSKRMFAILGRILFWIFVRELMSHFIYVSAMQFQVQHFDSFNSVARYGYGYMAGQFFHMKYVVFYGIGIAFGGFEGADMPGIPKCIGRIHLYSDMWKYFDEGLYRFILKYIYIPLQPTRGLLGKIIASFICFLFIFVWHGVTHTVLIWSAINYIVVTLEVLWRSFYKNYYNLFSKLSAAWTERLHALLAAPIFSVAIMSNFYFLINLESGHIFFRKFFYSELTSALLVLCVMYTGCIVSIEVKRWEQNKKHKKIV